MGIDILFELATLTCSSMIMLVENKCFYPFLKNKIRYPFKKEQTCMFPVACLLEEVKPHITLLLPLYIIS
jgi:hypothetical protein